MNCNLIDPPSEFGSPVPLQKCESTPNACSPLRNEPIAGVLDWDCPTPRYTE